MAVIFFDGSRFHEQVLKRLTQRNNLVKLFQIVTSGFREDFLISSCPYSAKKSSPPPPTHRGHVFQQINISLTNFEKGHPKNIPVKLLQNQTRGFRKEDFFKNFFKFISSPLPAPLGGHVLRHIKISRTILYKRAMMALDCSPELFFPTNEFYIFVPLVPTCHPQF